jgi:nicotinate-nucleotide pyrophosphorylase (carboxylating)
MWGDTYRIEVEARTLEEVRVALDSAADRIMLDNMSLRMMKEAVRMVGETAETEASGNVTIERLPSIADTGVNFISVGGLTHTVTAFDFSLRK